MFVVASSTIKPPCVCLVRTSNPSISEENNTASTACLPAVAQREAADTQRRLYLRQSELETELEDLNAHHDALRVEMARMDASMQDAADDSFPSSSSSSGRGGGGGAAGRKSAARDPAAIGAEVGGAVGGVLSGRFWSGWRGGGGGTADTAEGAASRASREGASKISKAGGGGSGSTRSGVVAGAGDATQEVRVWPRLLFGCPPGAALRLPGRFIPD